MSPSYTGRHLWPRVLGALTLAYGIWTVTRPASLVRAADLEPADQPISGAGRALGRLVGLRDAASGLAMMTAPVGAPLQHAVAFRVACDAADVVALGASAPPGSRAKVVAVAAGWGLVCATSWPAADARR